MQAAAASVAAPEGYQAFMSPFTQDVINQSMQDIARGGAMQQGQLAGQATGAASVVLAQPWPLVNWLVVH